MKTVKQLADEARNTLETQGYVQALPTFPWIEKDWLNKALEEGVLVRLEDGYYPVASVYEEPNVVGYRGRSQVIEGLKSRTDISEFLNFLKRYSNFENQLEDITNEDC